MKHRIFYLLFFIPVTVFCQFPTWSDDVAPIVYTKCVQCHHDNGIAPFSLMTYPEAFLYAYDIEHAVADGHMPPWPADPDYRHFANENILTPEEKLILTTWFSTGAQSGDLGTAPAPPVFESGGSVLDTIHHTVEIEPYTLQYDTDEYRWFVVHTSFPDPVFISKIEVVPGLANLVHHADISYDITGISSGYDDADPLSGFNGLTGAPNYSYYINAWMAGGNVVEYPQDWGVEIPPGADFVIEIHYGPGGIGQTDTTKFNLEFLSPDVVSPRPVDVGFLLYDSSPCLVDGPLVIPANQVVDFHHESSPLPYPISVVSISPHMHLLGKSFKVWAVTPAQDTIDLIDIPQWTFHWQYYYTYPSIQVLPTGTVIYSKGWYDNTINNIDNPNSPPQTVYKGPYTTDEMFLCYFIYTNYQWGDENIVLDSATWQLQTEAYDTAEKLPVLYPNPSTDRVYIDIPGLANSLDEVMIVDASGRFITYLQPLESMGEKMCFDVSVLPAGMYFVRWNSGDKNGVVRMVKE